MLVLSLRICLYVCKTRFKLQCYYDAFLPNQCHSIQPSPWTCNITSDCFSPSTDIHFLSAFYALFTEEDYLKVCQQIRPHAYFSVCHNRRMCPIDLPWTGGRINSPSSPRPSKMDRVSLRAFHRSWSCINVEHRNISHL